MRAFALIVGICLTITALAYAGTTRVGAFALQGGVANTAGFLDAALGAGGAWRFDFWMTPKTGGAPIRAYSLDMTKLLHVIIVSDDFKTFLHVHPALLSTGHFTLDQPLPGPGLYHIYSDGEPSGFGQQVFRFDVQAGKVIPVGPRDLSERSETAQADGYAVTLSSLSLRPGSETHIAVSITKGGKPATDVHPYLGALAHAVFLDAHDLSYVHVHPGAAGMTSMTMGPAETPAYSNDRAVVSPNMFLHVNVREPGTYKLWLQFRAGTSLHVAAFVLTASAEPL